MARLWRPGDPSGDLSDCPLRHEGESLDVDWFGVDRWRNGEWRDVDWFGATIQRGDLLRWRGCGCGHGFVGTHYGVVLSRAHDSVQVRLVDSGDVSRVIMDAAFAKDARPLEREEKS